MKLIVLKGEPDAGKTVTINYVYNKLRGEGYIEPFRDVFKDLENGDFLTVLEKERIKLGIVSQGDYVRGDCSVKKHLESLWHAASTSSLLVFSAHAEVVPHRPMAREKI